MTHPLVEQLYFARSEFARCLEGVTAEDAERRALPMNSLSWIVGHLANQEASYWIYLAQGQAVHPELREITGSGRPASTPPWEPMWTAWREVTSVANCYLDTLTGADLKTFLMNKGQPHKESIGTMLYRNLYHYWFHTGEAHGIRQALGHSGLADFVGDLSACPWREA